jgi:hypothetical protein
VKPVADGSRFEHILRSCCSSALGLKPEVVAARTWSRRVWLRVGSVLQILSSWWMLLLSRS